MLRSSVPGRTPWGLQCLLVGLLLILMSASSPTLAETRLALVISNASYPAEIGKLENPHKDGAVIAAALDAVGFEKRNITVLKDADQPTMRLAIADFIERIEKSGSDAVVFLYYSGHGAADRTERGENYLIPVGAKITLARQLPILGVSLSEITKALERVPAKARFVIVDACRNVAFTKGLKDAAKGFVPERKLDGMIVAFATRPGETAEDNNVYASSLAGILPTPGLRAEEVFKETQLKVADLTKGTQIPWTEDGLLTRFKFKDTAQEAAPSPSTPAPQASEAVQVWKLLETSTDIRALEAFRRQYGAANAFFDRLAEDRIEDLKKQQVAIAAPPQQEAPATLTKPAAAITPARCDGVEITVGEGERRCFKPGAGRTGQFKDCPTCPEMVVAPAGTFTMGSPTNEPESSSDEVQTRVSIAAPFAVGKYAVTFDEWDACVADGGCSVYKPADEGWGRGKHPVINVNWDDAKAYTAWLSRKTGKTYRLLSEAEREYVTRAGTTTPFWWGSSITPKQANYNGSADPYKGGGSKGEYRRRTVPVDSFEPNPWGLYNVHGNVRDWTEDCWNDSNSGNSADGSARSTGDCSRRVVRGGSWFDFPQFLRSAYRYGNTSISRNNGNGFRLARTLKP
jgi:formylglycine-generating enzyme required for sulfatase activity